MSDGQWALINVAVGALSIAGMFITVYLVKRK